ncbi:GAF domain-containing protein [bacterium]|nr:GAF domain-containing protein [bacterium]
MTINRITLISEDPSWADLLSLLLGMKEIQVESILSSQLENQTPIRSSIVLFDYDTNTELAVQQIQSLLKTNDQLQILLSSNSDICDLDRFENLNLFGVIDKPFSIKGMFTILKALEFVELKASKLSPSDPKMPYYLRLSGLMSVFHELGNFNQLDELLHFIIRSVTKTIDSERSSLFLADHHNNELYSSIAEGMEGKEIRFPIGIGIAGSVAQTKQTILIPDPYDDDRFNPDFDKKTGFVTKNILCMPMCNMENKVIGVIQVLNKKGGDFLQEDIDLLSALCTHAAVSLESTILFTQMEKLVALKTKDLQSALDSNRNILENIDNGILILDENLNICEGFSKSCGALLSNSDLQNLSFCNLPFQSVKGFEPWNETQVSNWLRYGFDNPMMDRWEELSDKNHFLIDDKIIRITFQRIINQDKVSLIMVMLSDFTQTYYLEQAMEKKSEEAKLQMEAILAMTQMGKKDSAENLSQIKESFLSLDILYTRKKFQENEINEAFRHIHTLKAHCATIGLKEFANLLHKEEDSWMEYRNQGKISSSDLALRQERLNYFINTIIAYKPLEQKLFSSESGDHVQIPNDEFEELLVNFKESSKAQIKKTLLHYKEHSFNHISRTLEKSALQIAKDTNKKIQWNYDASEDLIPEKIWKPLSGVFSHLIRNSLDHGIELPQTRVERGKDETGNMSFSYKASKKRYKFMFSDDGNGIDLEKVKKTALKKSIIQEGDQLSEKEIIDLIFQASFSTKTKVTDLSGRGVGMDVVKTTIEDLNGSIEMKQKTGLGLEITIEIPVS